MVVFLNFSKKNLPLNVKCSQGRGSNFGGNTLWQKAGSFSTLYRETKYFGSGLDGCLLNFYYILLYYILSLILLFWTEISPVLFERCAPKDSRERKRKKNSISLATFIKSVIYILNWGLSSRPNNAQYFLHSYINNVNPLSCLRVPDCVTNLWGYQRRQSVLHP